MTEPPKPLTPAEMQEQLRRFAETNGSSRAARSVRYDLGIAHPDGPAAPSPDHRTVPPDLSRPMAANEWQCTACGAKLDGSGLKIHTTRLGSDGRELAMCPHCGGAAYSLHQESDRQFRAFEHQQAEQSHALRSSIICGTVLLLFLWSPSTMTYLLCWIAAFWAGPLREVHLKMKLGAVFVIMWAGFFCTFAIGVTGMDHVGKLLVWLLVTTVLVGTGWLIEKAAAFGGGLFYKG